MIEYEAVLKLEKMPKSCSECELGHATFAVVSVEGVDTKQFVYTCGVGKGVVLKGVLNSQCPLDPITPLDVNIEEALKMLKPRAWGIKIRTELDVAYDTIRQVLQDKYEV